MKKEKFLKFVKDYKMLIVLFFVCLLLLTVELVLIFTKPKSKTKEEKVINKELSEQEKKVLGVDEEKSITNDIENQIAKRVENKEKENYSDDYKKYEKLSDEEKEKIDIIPSKENVSIDELDNINDNEEFDNIEKIPEKFKLTDKIKMNFESQGEYGLCWDFSSMKTIESFLKLHNLGEYNFSEIHVDYIMSDLLFGDRSLHDGGNFEYLVQYSSINGGFVDTKKLDYENDYSKEEYLKFKDTEKIPYIITEYVQFPTIKKRDGKFYDMENYDTPITNEQMNKYIETLKKHIMVNGGIEVSIFSDEFIAPEGRSYYSPGDTAFSDHAITIIGWDDNYSKEKFMSYNYDEIFEKQEKGESVETKIIESHPSRDGAFIAVNSWSDEEEYYYISYEDPTVYSNMFGITSVSFENALKLSDYSDNFQKLLKRELSKYIVKSNGEEYITKAVADYVYALDLSNGGNLLDTDLKALSFFKNIHTLDLSNNNINTLDYLPNLDELFLINLSNNNLTDISKINNLKNLTDIDLSNNNIKDVSQLKNKDLFTINLSGNTDITGYENLKADVIDLSNCNIKKFNSTLEYSILNLSDNNDIKIEKIGNVYSLVINNSNLKSLDFINNIENEEIRIEAKNNNIESIKPLESKNIYYLDLSGNKNINDLDLLNKVFTKDKYDEMKKERENIYNDEEDSNDGNIETSLSKIVYNLFSPMIKYDEDNEETNSEYEYGDYGMYDFHTELILNNCGINNINVFKNVYVNNLSLASNEIVSTSEFKNDSIKSIDLSNNKFNDKSYIDLINNFNIVYLKNCEIKDLNGINKREINTLDLSDNLITDISPLKGSEIRYLSLANNKIENGKLSDIQEIKTLNISNCDIDNDEFVIDDYEELESINIANNDKYSNYDSLLENENLYSIYLGDSNLDFSKVVDTEGKSIYGTFTMNLKSDNGLISINPNTALYDILREMYYNELSDRKISLYNGYLDKYVENIIVIDESKKVVLSANDRNMYSPQVQYSLVLNK